MEVEMFSSKEEKEARKQHKARTLELKNHLLKLKHHLKQRQGAYAQAIEAYKQSVAEKWEYLEVSSKNVKEWGSLDRLGWMGWELVGASTYAEGEGYMTVYTLYVFKRKLAKIPDGLLAEFADIPERKSEIKQVESEISSFAQ